MEAIKLSKNVKLNEVLTSIYDSLINMCDTKKESISEIKRYVKEFRHEPDYNLFRYGNLLVYYSDIRNLYRNYKSLQKASNEKIEQIYMRQIRYITNYILSNNKY